MPRALKVCSTSGCPNLTATARCARCNAEAERARGNRHQRGYGRMHEQRFRPGVLRKDPICTCTDGCPEHGERCWAQSTVADHWPLNRRELVAAGLDPNDPARGRGLCKGCHDHHTARAQPGGWHGNRS